MKAPALKVGLLAAAIFLGVPARGAAQTPYTLQTAYNQLHEWGVASRRYSERRWELTRDSVLGAMIGSTLVVRRFPVHAPDVVVKDGDAEYARRLDLSLGPVNWLEPHFDTNDSSLRSTSEFRIIDVSYVDVILKDTGDRLALQLEGRNRISVFGRISEARIESESISLTIDMMRWTVVQ